jgi:hypothetical protein
MQVPTIISMIIHRMILKTTRKKIQFHFRSIEVITSVNLNKNVWNFLCALLGKTLLIVITATYCKYTQQYPYLNQLKTYYPSDSFEILAFPCNQFGLVRVFLLRNMLIYYFKARTWCYRCRNSKWNSICSTYVSSQSLI